MLIWFEEVLVCEVDEFFVMIFIVVNEVFDVEVFVKFVL